MVEAYSLSVQPEVQAPFAGCSRRQSRSPDRSKEPIRTIAPGYPARVEAHVREPRDLHLGRHAVRAYYGPTVAQTTQACTAQLPAFPPVDSRPAAIHPVPASVGRLVERKVFVIAPVSVPRSCLAAPAARRHPQVPAVPSGSARFRNRPPAATGFAPWPS